MPIPLAATRSTLCWSLCLTLAATVFGAAPQNAPPGAVEEEPQTPAARFEEQVEVIEVLVDVLATDRRGRTVRGLTPQDFIVEEGGERREVTSATFYTSRYEDLAPGGDGSAPAPEGFPPPDLPASRYFILFFHDQTGEASNSSLLTSMRLRAARDAREWVESAMAPSDWFAVVRYDVELSVQSDFTQDRRAILDAIENATLDRRTDTLRPSVRARREAGPGPSLLAGLPHSYSIDRAAVRPEDAVRVVAEAARPIIGRKNLVLFTLGFGRVESRIGAPDERYYPAMQAALNDSNTAVYPVDMNGPGNQTAQSNFLGQIADETGGTYYSTFNRFLDPLREISRTTTGYYLLSFRSEVPMGESGYRTFRVTSPDRKVRIRARRGYRYGPRADG